MERHLLCILHPSSRSGLGDDNFGLLNEVFQEPYLGTDSHLTSIK